MSVPGLVSYLQIMDTGLLWTAVGTAAGVAAVGLTAWQVRLQFLEHRHPRLQSARRALAELADPPGQVIGQPG